MKVIKGGKNTLKKKPTTRYDWEAIGIDFRAGFISIRAVSRKHKIDYGYLMREAKKRGWQRDLTDAVRKAVRNRLVRNKAAQATNEKVISKEVIKQSPSPKSSNKKETELTDEEVVEAAAFVEIVFINEWDKRFGKTLDVVTSLKNEILSDDSVEFYIGSKKYTTKYTPKERAAMLNAITQAEIRVFEGMRKNMGITGESGGQEAPAIITDYGTGNYEKELARRKAGTDSV